MLEGKLRENTDKINKLKDFAKKNEKRHCKYNHLFFLVYSIVKVVVL